MGTVSNYEKMKNAMAESFLHYDQGEMIRKFSLQADPNYLYMTFVNRPYRIDRQNGCVQWLDVSLEAPHEADYNEAMTIYDVLCNARDNAHLAGDFVNINALTGLQTGNLSENGSFFQRTADSFQGKTAQLACACEALSGVKIDHGDAAYRLELFPFLPVILRFWDADEEFPPSLQILADQNTLDYMHYETLMFALGHLFRRIKEEMPDEKR